MTEQSSAILSAQTEGETAPRRRLVDKINEAALQALDHGRREIASKLRLLHDAVVEQEMADGYADRSDDDLKKWLDRRFNSEAAKRRIRPKYF